MDHFEEEDLEFTADNVFQELDSEDEEVDDDDLEAFDDEDGEDEYYEEEGLLTAFDDD